MLCAKTLKTKIADKYALKSLNEMKKKKNWFWAEATSILDNCPANSFELRIFFVDSQVKSIFVLKVVLKVEKIKVN